MATNEQMREQIKAAHAKIKALRQHQRSLEQRIELQGKELSGMQEQIDSFGQLVRDLAGSIQKAAHANYSAIDRRLSKLEQPDTDEAEAEAADALADLPASER